MRQTKRAVLAAAMATGAIAGGALALSGIPAVTSLVSTSTMAVAADAAVEPSSTNVSDDAQRQKIGRAHV